MKLVKAQVQNYRSIKDTGEFTIEELKTILVGPNEAGKTVILQALQQLNKPADIEGFDALRDYPRSLYNDITTGKVNPEYVTIVTGYFKLDDKDKAAIPSEYHNCEYIITRRLNNKYTHKLEGAPATIYYKDIRDDLTRLVASMDKEYSKTEENSAKLPSTLLNTIKSTYSDYTNIEDEVSKSLKKWMEDNIIYVDEGNEKELQRHEKLLNLIGRNDVTNKVLKDFKTLLPVFVLFNNYVKVKPNIHLEHLADRHEKNLLEDDKYYDYGNLCLLKLLGFTSRDLSNIGKTQSPAQNNPAALKVYRDTLDKRSYQLDAASVRLTREIKEIWNPNPNRPEAEKLVISADGQYLKVTVEDEIGVKIELDQRSEGFQWLVSFYIVFFAEAMDKHENAILLLDEPGMSLHGLKQRDFRDTISRLAKNNQTIYTTHSPFLVGADELDLVRVVELKDREEGTRVHTTISSSDPAGLLPLQEALGYGLAQSLFTQERNLVLEGLTDYWYIEATANLLREDKVKNANLDEKIALVFANSAGKVVYYATILHAQKMKVAALLDSDAAGDQAAEQENLVHTLGNKNILRTKDYRKDIPNAEIEDLLRDTLVEVVKALYGVDMKNEISKNPTRPIIDLLKGKIKDFSKYKLAKAYVRWTREHEAKDLSKVEIENWSSLIETINKTLK